MASQYTSGLISILVGPEKREFVVHKQLLCAHSAFFRDNIDAVPAGISSAALPSRASGRQPMILWLADESSGMFELFILWLYRRHAFRDMVEEAVAVLASEWEENSGDELLRLSAPDLVPDLAPWSSSSAPSSADLLLPVAQCCSELHWNLVDLHLFAALVDIPALQDVVMDCLQDLYLRFDWEASPSLLRVLYAECDPSAAFRLRKWAVALLAWTLSNRGITKEKASERSEDKASESKDKACEARQFLALFKENPQLLADYDAHMTKMAISQADARIKNPQLRIPSNILRREDRHFGFRQCSFHSHRRAVGQGPCPHSSKNGQDWGGHAGLADAHTHSRTSSRQASTCCGGTLSSASPSSSLSPITWSPCPEDPVSEPRHVDLPAWSPLSLASSSG